jgi:apolipoprotein D and lipocalin family protein
MKIFLSLLFLITVTQNADASLAGTPLRTVEHVELERYLGKWYEISSYPQRFQKGCTATTANYSLKDNGNIRVINECRLQSPQGKLKVAKGTAKIVDEVSNAKLKVSFFWPFYGAYWIIDLGENYEYAVVGHPDRNYLWILSRTPTMDATTYQEILARLTEQQYDISKLVKTIW